MFFPDKVARGSHFIASFDETKILEGAPTLDLEITRGRKLVVRLVSVPIHAIKLDPNNPRIRHRAESDEAEIEEWLWHETGTRNLYNEIRYSGGLSEKPIIDSSFTVVEGNRRIVCLRRLNDQVRNGELLDFKEGAFEFVQCLMLPESVPPADLSLLLARVHVSGKKEWSPLNQAQRVFEMVTEHGMSTRDIASALSIGPYKAEVMLRAFQTTLEYGKLYPDVDSKWVHKFSYFYELFRHRGLGEWAKKRRNLRTFMRLISGEHPRISLGSQVRGLAYIVADQEAFPVLKSDGYEKAFEIVKRKQSHIDQYTKTLEQASQTLLKMSKDQISLTTEKVRVLGDIKQRVDNLLLRRPIQIEQPLR